jgi:zinc D-Ala-D-Ala carboxypeptidase
MYKTKHFSLFEYLQSDTANRLHIDNTPTFDVVYNLLRLTQLVLDGTRDKIGMPIRVTSGYRSVALNRAVGGVHNSQHITGCAADLKCNNMQLLFETLALNPNVDQLLYEHDGKGGKWIHVSIAPIDKRPRHYINDLFYAK